MKPTPPYHALKFLRWFCREEYLDEIEGDLIEIYETQYKSSPAKAKRHFFWNILRHLRPEFIKTFRLKQNSISTTMIRHNVLLALRNYRKYTGSFMINLTGLSSGIACALLIYLWVADELSVDKFHANEGRIYQVMSNIPLPGDTLTLSTTPAILAEALVEDFPEVELASSVLTPDWFDYEKGIANYAERFIKAKGQFVQPDYLKIFSWELLAGDRTTVLDDKYAVLVSDQMAIQLFGNLESAVGEVIEWDQDKSEGTYHVTGVFKKPPVNSTAQFDLLFNYQSVFERERNNWEQWDNSSPDTYLLLAEGADLQKFAAKLKNYKLKKYEAQNGSEYVDHIGTLFPRAYSEGYLYNSYTYGQQTGGRIAYVKLFSLIAVFILSIACINFMNLATARASRRLKEIGIKKAIGANRSSLISQFLTESVVVTLCSVLIGLLIALLLLPSFNKLAGKQLNLEFNGPFIGTLFLLTLLVAFFSGSYPALYLSRFKPSSILKGRISSHNSRAGFSESLVRKGLVVFQFAVSIILIVSVVVVYNQIHLIQTKNLGYNDENIIFFTSTGKLKNETAVFTNEVKKIPGVIGASSFGHDLVGQHGGNSGVIWPGKLPGQGIEFARLEVSYNWIELLEIEMAYGRTFSDDYPTDLGSVIFNEAAIKAMGLEDPIGQTIKYGRSDRIIIGVVKDFNFESLYDDIYPCMIQLKPNLSSILVKIDSDHTSETISKIETFHKEYNNGLPLDYKFMDENYEQLYAAEQKVATLSRYFAGITILISCLGLLALAAFTAEKRQKEIGIRKLLGSSVIDIVRLLSSDFTKMVAISILISLPLSYYLAAKWLDSFAFRVDISWWWFAVSGLSALMIAWLTVSIQTFKAANLNPVDCLKNE
ncbi:MAG: FtsX-like permease family protein [Bacteroidota bacterium]